MVLRIVFCHVLMLIHELADIGIDERRDVSFGNLKAIEKASGTRWVKYYHMYGDDQVNLSITVAHPRISGDTVHEQC